MTTIASGEPGSPAPPPYEARRGEYLASDDPARLDLDVIHGYLARSYWSPGVPRATTERAVANSLCLGVRHDGGGQVAFARVVTDRATFAYLCDVFVLEGHRGRGLGEWMVELLHAHPALQGLRRWMLATRDAHGLYAKLGWTPLPSPERFMERHFPGVYAPPPEE